MIKKILCLLVVAFALHSNADTPGKKAMSDSKITIKNISRLTDYDFFWQEKYNDSVLLIKGDTTVIIPGSGGAPDHGIFWAINRKTKLITDTIYFENYYSPDYEITIDTIANDKFQYAKKEISNNNAGGPGGSEDPEDNSGPSTKIILFASLSLLALILLVWFFIRRKNTHQSN